jgi:hypothetical protein
MARSLVSLLRRLCDGPGADTSSFVIVVASGPGWPHHLLDLVLADLVGLATVAGTLLHINLGAAQAFQPEHEERLVRAIQHHVPVLIRTDAGVPATLVRTPWLRLRTAHIPSSLLPAVSHAEWTDSLQGQLWAAMQALPPSTPNSMYADAQWRPVPVGTDLFQLDAALVAEMLHGSHGLAFCCDGAAPLQLVMEVYAQYRRSRGYFTAAAAASGITVATLQAAAAMVGSSFADAITATMPSIACPCVTVNGLVVTRLGGAEAGSSLYGPPCGGRDGSGIGGWGAVKVEDAADGGRGGDDRMDHDGGTGGATSVSLSQQTRRPFAYSLFDDRL